MNNMIFRNTVLFNNMVGCADLRLHAIVPVIFGTGNNDGPVVGGCCNAKENNKQKGYFEHLLIIIIKIRF